MKIAYFISPHGFGHASRASAVMEELYIINPKIEFEIFTKVPEWFFKSLKCRFNYHSVLTDIGFVQKTPLIEDINETIKKLDDFLPFKKNDIQCLAGIINKLKCKIVLCDISPMGIAVAKKAQLPSVLIENFTWDWIYNGYKKFSSKIVKFSNYLINIFNSADFHIQTRPECLKNKGDLLVGPVSRNYRKDSNIIRKELGVSDNDRLVLITMGGIPPQYSFLQKLKNFKGCYFIIPGSCDHFKVDKNLIMLPHHSEFYHPDLVNASDVVIGKIGYSTLAEAYASAKPFGYITRPRFKESKILEQFVKKEMAGIKITQENFKKGAFLKSVNNLLCMEKVRHYNSNGAKTTAKFILSIKKLTS